MPQRNRTLQALAIKSCIICATVWTTYPPVQLFIGYSTQPDPQKVRYEAMVRATAAIVVRMQLSTQNCYLRMDYHSVPQHNRTLQALAIKTPP